MWKDAEFFMFTWGHWPSGWQPKRCWGRILSGTCTTAAADFAPLSIIFHFWSFERQESVCASDTWKVSLFMYFLFRWTQMDTDGHWHMDRHASQSHVWSSIEVTRHKLWAAHLGRGRGELDRFHVTSLSLRILQNISLSKKYALILFEGGLWKSHV